MTSFRYKRIKQVLKYGWKDAKEISNMQNVHRSRLSVFVEIISCFKQYYVFSNQYKQNRFWELNPEELYESATNLGKENKRHDDWWTDYFENRQWLNKWMKYKWETTSRKILQRNKAYQKHFKTGKISVQYNVDICREHCLEGTLSIGNNVLLAKNVFIDYSGFVEIKDNVQLTNGVIIESHYHPWHSDFKYIKEENIQTNLVVEESAVIGSRAIVLASCHYIGKYARVGAGAVVTHDVPDYAVVVGCPARIVRMMTE